MRGLAVFLFSVLAFGQGVRQVPLTSYLGSTPKAQQITVVEGDTPQVVLTIYTGTSGTTAATLTGYTSLLTFANADGGQTVTGGTPADGVIVFQFDSDDTSSPGRFSYDIRITDSTEAYVHTVARGVLTVLDDVSVTTESNLGSLYVYDASGAVEEIDAITHSDGTIIVSDGTDWVGESGATARASLGVSIGSDVEAYDADLAAIAALEHTEGYAIVSSSGSWTAADIGADAIAELSDVTITDVGDAELLGYQTDGWINGTLAEWGIAASGHDHSGVYEPADAELSEIAAVTPSNGDVLYYSTDTWAGGDLAAAGIAASGHDHSGTYEPAFGAGSIATQDADSVVISPGVVSGSASDLTLSFGDGDSGWWESADDTLSLATNGIIRMSASTASFASAAGGGFRLPYTAASATAPTLQPSNSDTDTGVGSQTADSLSLISGAKEMLRLVETGTAGTDQVIVSPGVVSGAAATPSLALGDGDSGWWESADDTLKISTNGVNRVVINSNGFAVDQSAPAPMLVVETVTATNPGFVFSGDVDTGVGSQTADSLSLISGAKEMMRLVETGTAGTDQVIFTPGFVGGSSGAATPTVGMGDGDSGLREFSDDTIAVTTNGVDRFYIGASSIASTTAGSWRFPFGSASTATVPTLQPSGSDTDTGIGGTADSLSLISGSKEMMRLVETGTAATDQVIFTPGVVSGAEATPSLALGDGDSGWYEVSDDVIGVSIAASQRWYFEANDLMPFEIYGAMLSADAGSATSPNFTFRNDENTGVMRPGSDQVGFVAGAVEAVRYREDGGVLVETQVTAGITASTTQSQGQQALTSSYNEVSTVGTEDDVVTLPTARAGSHCVIINNGANTLQIFPASDDNLGAGVNTATTLSAGSNVHFFAYDTTNWEIL